LFGGTSLGVRRLVGRADPAYFTSGLRAVLSHHLTDSSRRKLINWGCVTELKKADVLGALQYRPPPKPRTWRQVLVLWAYIADELSRYSYEYQRYYYNRRDIRLIPVQGRGELYAAREVARLGEKKALRSEEDWAFLSESLLV